MDIVIFLAIVVLYLWAVHSIARTAEGKGRSYSAFSAIAFFITPVLAWIIVSSISADLPKPGDAVETLQKIELEGGKIVPRKHVTKVLDVDVKEKTPVVQIDVGGRTAWVARKTVKKL